jgi:hypothetical protein
MAPYSENLKAVPYICHYREDIERQYQLYTTSQSYNKEYNKLEKYMEDHCGYDMIDKDGNILTDYNENSLWDWYQIGKEYHQYSKTLPYNTSGDLIDRNSVQVSVFLEEYRKNKEQNTYCWIIDVNGVLHYKEGCSESDETEDDVWAEELEDVLVLSPDDYVVSIDCSD